MKKYSLSTLLKKACIKNKNLDILKPYKIASQHPDIFFCDALEVTSQN